MPASPKKRVVITGMGIVAPNANSVEEFHIALKNGKSGLKYQERLEELDFQCQVAGIPQGLDEKITQYIPEADLIAMNDPMIYATIASIEAYKDANLSIPDDKEAKGDPQTGACIGIAMSGVDTVAQKLVPKVQAKKIRRMGSTLVEQIMTSSVSAKIGGLLGLQNWVTSNSSACATGSEAIGIAYRHIQNGYAKRMLAGSSEGSDPHIWAGFDAMRLLNSKFNQNPENASRPMSACTSGFIPGSGCGILILEELESAQARKTPIYAEIIASFSNCGGQRKEGSITTPNSEAVRFNIQECLKEAQIQGTDINYINGHLTGSFADPIEIENWKEALNLSEEEFPPINATKSLIGHGLGASGSMESIACILQLKHNFIHPSRNCEDLHPKLEKYASSIIQTKVSKELKIASKASLGFGDVNTCLIFKAWSK